MAKIVVGPKAKRFTVHLNLIVYHSPFFLAALKGPFKEAKDKVVALPDTDANIFELFANWLYRQRFPTEADSPQLLALYHRDEDANFRFDRLVRLYVFSDKYDVPKLKRQCLDTIFEYLVDEDLLPDLSHVVYAVKNLDDKDPLLRMIIDCFCYWSGSDCWVASRIEMLPAPFLARIMGQFVDFRHGGLDSVDEPDLCDYHCHATSGERGACEYRREREEEASEMMKD